MISDAFKEFYKETHWKAWQHGWFYRIDLPHSLKYLFQLLLGYPKHKTILYNRIVYDGQSRNDFRKGNLVSFLYKVGAIKQLTWQEDDGRAYFIGYSDD